MEPTEQEDVYNLTDEEALMLEEIMMPAENQVRGALSMLMRFKKLIPPYNWDRQNRRLVRPQ